MPEISRFHGIVVRMFWEAGAPHHRPHFHAQYHDDDVVYAIDNIELLEGKLPPRQQRLLETWAILHQAELLENWMRMQRGQKRFWIVPLK